MTKLYKTTGIEYEIEYPPPPEPPPPAPDPQTPQPPGNYVARASSPKSDKPVDRNSSVTFVSCTTSDGSKGVRMFVDGNPASSCQKLDYQGMGG